MPQKILNLKVDDVNSKIAQLPLSPNKSQVNEQIRIKAQSINTLAGSMNQTVSSHSPRLTSLKLGKNSGVSP